MTSYDLSMLWRTDDAKSFIVFEISSAVKVTLSTQLKFETQSDLDFLTYF